MDVSPSLYPQLPAPAWTEDGRSSQNMAPAQGPAGAGFNLGVETVQTPPRSQEGSIVLEIATSIGFAIRM